MDKIILALWKWWRLRRLKAARTELESIGNDNGSAQSDIDQARCYIAIAIEKLEKMP